MMAGKGRSRSPKEDDKGAVKMSKADLEGGQEAGR